MRQLVIQLGYTLGLLICLSAIINAHGQASTEPSIRITKGTYSLLTILTEIEKQTGCTFAYSSSIINMNRSIATEARHIPLSVYLDQLLQPYGLAWEKNGKVITLYKNTKARFTISGYVKEYGTGEKLIGATITTLDAKLGTVTNSFGYFSITLPAQTDTLVIRHIGFKPVKKYIDLAGDEEWTIVMQNDAYMQEVLITGKKEKHNQYQIDVAEIDYMPSLLGEKDAIRYLMLNPGVQKGNEGASYLYVRGGAADQNLILMDDAVLYNVQHFLGISSLFSGNELRKLDLYKGGFSSMYGGRLSSVIDMRMKDGNRERFAGEASLGMISSRLSLEAPIIKNKSSFFLSGRVSYLDKLSARVAQNDEQVLDYTYYDLHAKVSTDIGSKNRLYISMYVGEDQYILANTTPDGSDAQDKIQWGNRAASLRWSSAVHKKWFVNTTATLSNYSNQFVISDFAIDNFTNMRNTSYVNSTILDLGLKQDWQFQPRPNHSLKFGLGTIRHFFNPSAGITNEDRIQNMVNDQINEAKFYSWENFVYAESQLKYKKLDMQFGLRCSQFITDGKDYFRAEPRLNIQYTIKKDWWASATYALMNQYVHQITNMNFGLPVDYWMPVTDQIKPQRSHLITGGLSKANMILPGIVVTLEGYYKQIDDAVWLREGSSFFSIVPGSVPGFGANFVPVDWNKMITQGTTTSYGLECMIKYESRKLQTWISYTLSRTMMHFQEINLGRPFPFTYDRTHDLGVFANYKPNRKYMFSASWIYGTGNAISLPIGTYTAKQFETIPGSGIILPVNDYGQKNSIRMRDYHRLDISFQYLHKWTEHIQARLDISVYNVYNRANPFFYTLENENQDGTGKTVVVQTSLFPIIPSISYAITF